MRIKNKELKRRRHRKEQVIKAAQRTLREQYGDKKTAPAAGTGTATRSKPVSAKKTSAAAATDATKVTAPKKETRPKAVAAEGETKPKAKKKAEGE